jgi:hypothetical protein
MKEKIKKYFRSENFNAFLWGSFFMFTPIFLYFIIIKDPIIGHYEDGEPRRLGIYIVVALFLVGSYSIYRLKEVKKELENSQNFTKELHSEFKKIQEENKQLKITLFKGRNLKDDL